MPEISRFLGIIITMYYNDHAPPHFHAIYGEHEAIISIDDFRFIKGFLPNRVKGLVIEWASMRKSELLKDWENAVNQKPLNKIEPLV